MAADPGLLLPRRVYHVDLATTWMTAGTLLAQQLKMKGLAAGEIDHCLRSIFGNAMRIEVAPADQEHDEGISANMRYGEQRLIWTD